MSYRKAAKCFHENTQLIDLEKDPVGWNLNNGLRMLLEEIQREFRNLDSKIVHISRQIDQLR